MSKKIDQRIVEMSFENHKFEKGIHESKGSLNEFSNALNKMGKGKDFDGLEKSVGSLSKSFSAFEQIAIGALRRIGEIAVNTGVSLAKNLSLDQITAGLSKYEQKIEAVQTMVSAGYNFDAVEASMEKLMWFADETSYSFSDMSGNMAKFISAGVDLKTSERAMQGIANWAAIAGKNSEAAGIAMFNLSQAISMGYVDTLNWRSIMNQNMNTVMFKEVVIGVAEAMGAVKKGKITIQNFDSDLKKKWFTNEVLLNSLELFSLFGEKVHEVQKEMNFDTAIAAIRYMEQNYEKYADVIETIGYKAFKAAQESKTFKDSIDATKDAVSTGWMRTYELVFGTLDEAKKNFTALTEILYTMFAAGGERRNELLFKALRSGWEQFTKEGISNITDFGNTLGEVAKEAGVDIDSLIQKTGSMEAAVQGNWLTGGMLIETVSRMAASVENLSEKELANIGYTEESRDSLIELRDSLLDGSISADEFAKKMGRTSGIQNLFQGLKNIAVALLKPLLAISKAWDKIFPPRTAERLYNTIASFKDFAASLIITDETADKLQRTFAGVFAVFSLIWDVVKIFKNALFELVKAFIPTADSLLDVTAAIGDFLVKTVNAIKSSEFFKQAMEAIKIGASFLRDVLGVVIQKIVEFVRGLREAENPLEYIGSVFRKIFGNIVEYVKIAAGWISKNFVSALSSVSEFIGGLFGPEVTNVFTVILDGIKSFVDFLVNVASDGIKGFGDVIKNLDFNKIATFVTGGILLLFVLQISSLTKAMTGLVTASTTLVSNFSKKLFASSTKLKDLALVIGVLAASIWVLSTIPTEDLIKGLIGLAAALLVFVAAYGALQLITSKTSKGGKGVVDSAKTGFNLIGFAIALTIMAGAVKKISTINEADVLRSVGIVAAMIGLITIYQVLSALISKIPGQGKLSTSILGMSIGIIGLVATITILNKVKDSTIEGGLKKLIKILAVIGSIQILFGVAARIGSGNKLSSSLLGIAAGVLALVGVMKLISGISEEEVEEGAKKLFAIGIVLAGLEALFGIAAFVSGGKKLKSNMLSITLGMLAMVGLIALINSFTDEEIDRGMLTLIKMGGLIAGIEIVTAASARLAGGNKTQRILGAVTLTMVAFTGIIAILNIFSDDQIERGISIIKRMVGIIAAIELITALSARISGGTKVLGTLGGIILVLITLAGSIALLGLIDQKTLETTSSSLEKVISSVQGLVLAIGIMGAVLSSLGPNAKKFSSLTDLIPAFVAVIAVIGATIGLFAIINEVSSTIENIKWESLGKLAAGIGMFMILMDAFNIMIISSIFKSGNVGQQLLSLVPAFAAAGITILAVTALFEIADGVLDKLKNIEWNELGKFAAGLGVFTILIAAITALAVPLQMVNAGILNGVIIAIAAVAAIVIAFAGLAEVMDMLYGSSNSLQNGIDLLIDIAEGIGRFVAKIIGAFAIELLTDIGTGIENLATSLSKVEPGAFDGIGDLASAILTITAASLLDGIVRFLSFGVSPISMLGTQISMMLESLANVKKDNIDGTTETLDLLRPMMENLKELIDVITSIPPSGGLVQLFTGNTTINEFGQQIRDFINAFKVVDADDADKAVEVINHLVPVISGAEKLFPMIEKIPPSGGLVQLFTGNTTINEFGQQIRDFINAFTLITKADAIRAVGIIDNLVPVIDGAGKLFPMIEKIPPSGGLVQLFTGNTTINEFGQQLRDFINAFKIVDADDAKKTTEIINALTPAIDALGGLSTLVSSLPKTSVFNIDMSLSILAIQLADFVMILRGVDFTIVKPALESLAAISTSFQAIGAEVMENAKQSFENNKEPYQVAIVEILNTTIKKIEDKNPEIVEAVENIFKDTLKKSVEYIVKFTQLGKDIVSGLNIGINDKKSEPINSITNLMKTLASIASKTVDVNSPSKVFATIGEWCTKGLAHGIENSQKLAFNAMTKLGRGSIEALRDATGVHSDSDEGIDIGKDLTGSFGKGNIMATPGVVQKHYETGYGSLSALLEGGKQFLKEKGASGFTTTITGLIDELTGDAAIDNALGKAGEFLGGTITDKTNETLKDKKKGLGGSKTKKTIKSELEKIQEYIDEEKYYNRITLEEEFALYDELQKKKNLSAEDQKKVNREVYRLVKEIYEAQLSYIDDVTKAETDAADKREKLWKDYLKNVKAANKEASKKLDELQKKYDADVLSAQQSAYKKSQDKEKRYQEDVAKILENAEKEKQKLREDYADKQTSLNEKLLSDIEAQNKAYEDAVKSRADAIYNSYSLFSAVEEDRVVAGEELLTNLRDQSAALGEWKQALDYLADKGVGNKLIEELQEMGPASKAEIKALLTLTDEQLTEYVNLFENKYAFATNKAVIELEGLKESTEQAIKDLNEQAAIDLSNLEKEFENSMADINAQMEKDLHELKTIFQAEMWEIQSDLNDRLTELKLSFDESFDEINKNLQEKLDEMAETYNDSLTEINKDVEEKLEELKKKFSDTMRDINGLTEEELRALIIENEKKLKLLNEDTAYFLDETKKEYSDTGELIVRGFRSDMETLDEQTSEDLGVFNKTVTEELDKTVNSFYTSGYNAARGFAAGIRAGTDLVKEAAKAMAAAAEAAAKGTLEENSPSKLFVEIGRFVSLGFANGIVDYADQAEHASKKLAEGPIAIVSKALAELETILDEDLNWYPEIVPVLDLSKIDQKALSNLFGTKDYKLSNGSVQLAYETIQNGIRNRKTQDQSPAPVSETPAGNSYNFTQNNYSPKALSRIDIYRQTKNQFSAMKAQVEGR